MPFYWPSCSLPFYLLLFSLSLLSFYGLVLWGWGLRTEGVNRSLPALHCQPLLIIIIIIIILALYVREGFGSFRQRKLEYSCHESCVFHICSRINKFYVYAVCHNPGYDGSLYDCLHDSMARIQSVDEAVFVGDINAHHSEWLESVSPTDRHGRDALDFCNLSGCEQLVSSPTHIAGNRLDLVMTDVPDIVDVVVGTPLGTSDHCFVSCVLRVEQSVQEYNARSTIFLKHRTNWDSVHSAVRSFTWSTILKLANPLVSFD